MPARARTRRGVRVPWCGGDPDGATSRDAARRATAIRPFARAAPGKPSRARRSARVRFASSVGAEALSSSGPDVRKGRRGSAELGSTARSSEARNSFAGLEGSVPTSERAIPRRRKGGAAWVASRSPSRYTPVVARRTMLGRSVNGAMQATTVMRSARAGAAAVRRARLPPIETPASPTRPCKASGVSPAAVTSSIVDRNVAGVSSPRPMPGSSGTKTRKPARASPAPSRRTIGCLRPSGVAPLTNTSAGQGGRVPGLRTVVGTSP